MKAGRPKTTVKQRLKKITFDFKKITEIAKYGLTDEQLAIVLGVNECTITRWKKDPIFLHALKKGKEAADMHVQESMYQAAKGYSHPDKKIFCNAKGEVTEVETVKHYPPDATMAIFWMKNRQPDKWRDKKEHHHQVDVGEQTINVNLSTGELAQEINNRLVGQFSEN